VRTEAEFLNAARVLELVVEFCEEWDLQVVGEVLPTERFSGAGAEP
jgi:hypothetical protein